MQFCISSILTILSCDTISFISFWNASTQIAAIWLVWSGAYLVHVAPWSYPSLIMVNGLVLGFTNHQHHLLTGLASGRTMAHRDWDRPRASPHIIVHDNGAVSQCHTTHLHAWWPSRHWAHFAFYSKGTARLEFIPKVCKCPWGGVKDT